MAPQHQRRRKDLYPAKAAHLRAISFLLSHALLFFLFLIQELVIVLVQIVAVHMRQLQRLRSDNLKLRPALIARDNVALFYFIFLQIEWGLAFRTVRHRPFSFH